MGIFQNSCYMLNKYTFFYLPVLSLFHVDGFFSTLLRSLEYFFINCSKHVTIMGLGLELYGLIQVICLTMVWEFVNEAQTHFFLFADQGNLFAL